MQTFLSSYSLLSYAARRRKLAQQAEDIADAYAPDADWKAFQANDFVMGISLDDYKHH